MSDASSEKTKLVLSVAAAVIVTSILWWCGLDYAMDAKVQTLRTSLQAVKDQLRVERLNFDKLNNNTHELRLRYELMKRGVSDEEIERQVQDIIR